MLSQFLRKVLWRGLLGVLLLAGQVQAQAVPDSLFAVLEGRRLYLHHTVQPGQTIINLARRYFVPPRTLAEANGKAETDPLQTGAVLRIPLGAYNLTKSLSTGQQDQQPLYYRCVEDADLSQVTDALGIPKKKLVEWNRTSGYDCRAGKVLVLGGLRYDRTPIIPPAVPAADTIKIRPLKPPVPDTARAVVIAPLPDTAQVPPGLPDTVRAVTAPPARLGEEVVFQEMRRAGAPVVTESGAAVFFPSDSRQPFYAFHNDAPRGTVVRVHNPLNGRTIYARVLGTLPPIKRYAKAKIGLGALAREALGSLGDDRMWCEITYFRP